MLIGKIEFNHNGSVAKTKDVNGRPVLVQNGCMFTNAELNKFTGKWEPQPEFIAVDEPYKEFLAPKVLALIESVQKLEDTISQLIDPLKMVLSNERITQATAISPTDKGVAAITPITDENEFKKLGRTNFKSWVEKNQKRIGLLEPEDPILDTLIAKWEKQYGDEPLIV